jgi:hypothetical protein
VIKAPKTSNKKEKYPVSGVIITSHHLRKSILDLFCSFIAAPFIPVYINAPSKPDGTFRY